MKPLAPAAAALALCGLWLASGCRTMTGLKELHLARELKDQLVAETKASLERAEKEDAVAREKASRQDKGYEASVKLSAGDPAQALEIIEKIYKPPPVFRKDQKTGAEGFVPVDPPVLEPAEDARLHTLKATALYNLGRTDEAVEAFRLAMKLDPTYRQARRNLGTLLFLEKRYEEAIEAWKKELDDGYRDGEVLYQLAQARYERGKAEGDLSEIEAARLAMQAVFVERPRDPEVRRWLATLEYETGRYGEAIHLLEAIRKDNPLDPDYLELLGNAYLKVDDRRRALDFLELAAGIKAPTREGSRALGDLYLEEGLPGRAAEWLRRAYQDDPRQAPVEERLRVGQLLARSGQDQEALGWLSAVGEGAPEHGEAQAALAEVYRRLGRGDEAIAAYEVARKSRPQDGPAHLAAGRLYLERKRLAPAIDAFSRASGLPGTRAEGLAGLGDVAIEKGDLEAAIGLYRKALEASPAETRFISAIGRMEEELRTERS